jgi:hypothetical protein
MIFQIIEVYQKTKQGVVDPKGLALDELNGAFMGFFIVPALLLVGVLILLGILSFTSLITAPSLVAQVLFWIFVVTLVAYGVVVLMLRKLLNQVINRVAQMVIQDDHGTQ